MTVASQPITAKLPDGLVIGPGKAGTTWIHNYLIQRGDVALPRVKETFFFDRFYHRGVNWYGDHFSTAERTRSIAEVAPTYFHGHAAPHRVAQTVGLIPLICTLREPVARTHSLYLHWRRYGGTNAPLQDAIRDNPILLESSKYATLLRRWIDVFGRDNIKVLFLEDLARDPETYLRDLCQHLKLPFEGMDPNLNRAVNEASTPPVPSIARLGNRAAAVLRYYGFYEAVECAKRLGLKPLFFGRPDKSKLPKLSDEDRRWMTLQLGDEIDQLEQLLNVNLSHWKIPSVQQVA